MRHKEYIETCEICSKTYIATRKGSSVCGNACRAQKSRNKKKQVLDHITPRNTYHGVYGNQYLKIRGPEGSDIAKELNVRIGSERLIKKVKDNKRYVVEYIPMK